jgi:hypothetical protein
VQIVDHDGMGMMGPVFRKMRMVGRQVGVVVRQDGLVIGWPEAQHSRNASRANDC